MPPATAMAWGVPHALMLITQRAVRHGQVQGLGLRFKVHRFIGFDLIGLKLREEGIGFLVSGFWFLVSGFWFRV